jgi:hypothetical protein
MFHTCRQSVTSAIVQCQPGIDTIAERLPRQVLVTSLPSSAPSCPRLPGSISAVSMPAVSPQRLVAGNGAMPVTREYQCPFHDPDLPKDLVTVDINASTRWRLHWAAGDALGTLACFIHER